MNGFAENILDKFGYKGARADRRDSDSETENLLRAAPKIKSESTGLMKECKRGLYRLLKREDAAVEKDEDNNALVHRTFNPNKAKFTVIKLVGEENEGAKPVRFKVELGHNQLPFKLIIYQKRPGGPGEADGDDVEH